MAFFVIAWHEVRLRVRDRSVVILGLIAPFVLASIMGIAFASGDDALAVALVVQPAALAPGPLAALRDQLGPEVALRPTDDERAARQAVADGEADAVIVVRPAGVEVVGDNDEPQANAAATGVANRIARVLASDDNGDGAGAGAGAGVPRIVDDPAMSRSSPLGFFGPSMAILFLYFSVGSGARSLMAERRAGTMARLRVAPVGFTAVVAGKLAAIFAVALASMLSLWVLTTVLYDASWGSVVGVVVLSSATVVAIAGIASFIAARARDEAGADAATGIVAFLLALLGGNFFPPGALPDLFEKGSRLTPNGAALQAFARLSIDGAGLAEIAPALAVLMVVGVAFGAVGFGQLVTRGLRS